MILASIRQCMFLLLCLAPAARLLADAPNARLAQISMPPAPPREFRAAWIATVANIDWPSKPGLPVAQQKAELIALMDRAAQLHFNAVFFQVRPLSDAMYASSIEPWSEFLTGRQGQAPQPWYDPLALAIELAHQRGMELHAWFNPYRAGHPQSISPPSPSHISRTHPELVHHYGNQTVLDPGEPATQDRALAVVLDVVRRYDVDGVVLDDYFYPYPEKDASGRDLEYPDSAAWEKYGVHSGLNRDDWRRDNVNRFVLRLSLAIKAMKPWVQFGISPFGIWRPQNPPSIKGFDAYQKIFADSRRWLVSGWVDYLSPQLYWSIASRDQSFPVLLNWWRSQDPRGRHLWPALEDSSTGGKYQPQEISRQVQIIRQLGDPGEVHYHLRSVLDNPALAGLVGTQYAQPALVPASPWIDVTPPPRPVMHVALWKTTVHMDWKNGVGKPARWWLIQTHTNGVWTITVLPAGRDEADLDNFQGDAIALRAVDRLGNLSEPVVWTSGKGR
jgi:uncharacterized lipoprotein YddW (UPF0748 family)